MQPMPGELPDVYVDEFQANLSPYTVSMTFSLSAALPGPGSVTPASPKMVVRTSLQHAKIMAMILRSQLKDYERETGAEITLPMEVYRSIGIAPEDW
ncbi:MAG: hypothetical protein NTZ05_14630 [Chloroflexi bacterium]|nr:hypothetical protein [Chloroflexota bacterium]